jgi:VWFA-related protein
MHIDVVVTDKSGKPVSGLELKDFTLLDNKQPAKIVSFRAVDASAQKPDIPAEVILVLDAVNLDNLAARLSRDEMVKFLRQNDGHLAQPVSVFLFTDEGMKVLLQASTDGNALAAQLAQTESGLRSLGRASGGYGDIERLQLSIKWVAQIADAESKRPGRKLLLWAGPGWPLLDRPDLVQSNKGQQQTFNEIVKLSTLMREAEMTLYSVSVGDPGPGTFLYEGFLKGVKTADKANPSELGTKVLAVQTGGRVISPDNDMAAQIARCVQDASTYYTISFDPPRADKANEYHDLKIEVDKPGLTARTNTGYYNQP